MTRDRDDTGQGALFLTSTHGTPHVVDHGRKLDEIPTHGATSGPVAAEAGRAATDTGRRGSTLRAVYDAIARPGGATNIELATITPRYGARIYDLRQRRHVVIATPGAPSSGLYTYRLQR